MAAQPPPVALLQRTPQMSLNERFTALLQDTGPRSAAIRPPGWRRPPPARDLRRRARHVEYRARVPDACPLGETQAQGRAPVGSPEGALAVAVTGRGRDLLFTHGDSPLEGAGGPLAPRTVLKGGLSPRGQDPLPAGLALAPQRHLRRGALPARGGRYRGRLRSPAQRLDRKGPHPRACFGARGPGRGQGRSPLIRPRLTKEQLDEELDAYMAIPKAKERLDADLEAYRAQAVPHEGLDSDQDAYMADADPDTAMNTDP